MVKKTCVTSQSQCEIYLLSDSFLSEKSRQLNDEVLKNLPVGALLSSNPDFTAYGLHILRQVI